MITLSAFFAAGILLPLSANPALLAPALILFDALGIMVSVWILRTLRKAGPLFGCLAEWSLLEYAAYGFFTCAASEVIWPWILWGSGGTISLFLISGRRFPDRWLPLQRRWARLGLAWLSLGLLTAPLGWVVAAFASDLPNMPGSPLLLLLAFIASVLAWTAWEPLLIWRRLVG